MATHSLDEPLQSLGTQCQPARGRCQIGHSAQPLPEPSIGVVKLAILLPLDGQPPPGQGLAKIGRQSKTDRLSRMGDARSTFWIRRRCPGSGRRIGERLKQHRHRMATQCSGAAIHRTIALGLQRRGGPDNDAHGALATAHGRGDEARFYLQTAYLPLTGQLATIPEGIPAHLRPDLLLSPQLHRAENAAWTIRWRENPAASPAWRLAPGAVSRWICLPVRQFPGRLPPSPPANRLP